MSSCRNYDNIHVQYLGYINLINNIFHNTTLQILYGVCINMEIKSSHKSAWKVSSN